MNVWVIKCKYGGVVVIIVVVVDGQFAILKNFTMVSGVVFKFNVFVCMGEHGMMTAAFAFYMTRCFKFLLHNYASFATDIACYKNIKLSWI